MVSTLAERWMYVVGGRPRLARLRCDRRTVTFRDGTKFPISGVKNEHKEHNASNLEGLFYSKLSGLPASVYRQPARVFYPSGSGSIEGYLDVGEARGRLLNFCVGESAETRSMKQAPGIVRVRGMCKHLSIIRGLRTV